ncbi:hypothetical protein [Flavobacterium sp. 3HN19-14]|uniref:hypothetical protein n=1 Tax=Flavobacterium sp. 3HN19-14 TaxID=3448133 RepID=UPI003EE3AD1D
MTVGNYYTDATHTTPLANLTITGVGAHTIFVYAESASNASCNISATFTITITDTPVIATADSATVNACNDYTLPALTTTATSVGYFGGC